jgi:hypothetical protein
MMAYLSSQIWVLMHNVMKMTWSTEMYKPGQYSNGLWTEELRFDSWQGKEICLYSTAFRWSLGHISDPVGTGGSFSRDKASRAFNSPFTYI